MKTSIKKLIAGASIVALIAMNLTSVSAATPTAVIAGNTLTISTAGTSANEAVTVIVKKDLDTLTLDTDYTVSTATNDTIVITSVDNAGMDTGTDGIDAANYNVSYYTADGDIGTVIVNTIANGAANSYGVTVNAVVLPVLSMNITNPIITFDPLVLGQANKAPLNSVISVLSNGVGVNVKATYNQLLHTDGTTLAFKLNTNGGIAGSDVLTTENVINTAVYSQNAVTSTVSYIATPDANQKAGSYNTSVTYTVTGSF